MQLHLQNLSSMAALLLFLTLSALHSVAFSQQAQHNISLGSSLTPTKNSSWLSRSGRYAFGFYKEGSGYAVGVFIAGIREKTVVWTANADDPQKTVVPENSTLLLTTDGRLIVQTIPGQDLTLVSTNRAISAASIQDSGNFVLYNSSQEIMWQSFANPTNTLLPGQSLPADHQLISSASDANVSSGYFRLKMQLDGNLVMYPTDSEGIESLDTSEYAYWSSGTPGLGSTLSLNLDDDGRLYLLNGTGYVIQNITDGGYPANGSIFLARIDTDGIFRLYLHPSDQGNWSFVKQIPDDKCAPKGLCGFNSICRQPNTEAICNCLPGYDFVIQGNWRAGCARNISVELCSHESESAKYSIETLEGVTWGENTYALLPTTTLDDCQSACLEDCNCDAALFQEGTCKKQRLPFRFGRQSTDSDTALVKVGNPGAFVDSTESNLTQYKNKGSHVDILIVGSILVGFAFLILALSVTIVLRSRIWAYKRISDEGRIELVDHVAPQVFTFAELQQATKDFSEEIGRGGFGRVYKGVLTESQKTVAVKRLENFMQEREKEFKNEITTIGRTHHRNLVRLLGYCLDGLNRLLVYEYMSRGSLADILFAPENWPCWEERTQIACDIARGILYLHEECETQIIHCDIKPQNVLMCEHGCAKISDFGLAKLLKHDQTRTYTGIRGTRGYVAPEWHRGLPVTVKADVYSFGIMLLEIICLRKNVDPELPEDEAILEEWVHSCFESGQLRRLIGDENVDLKKLERLIKVGIWCIQEEPSLRPSMKKVLLMLEGTIDIPIPPSPTSFLSSI